LISLQNSGSINKEIPCVASEKQLSFLLAYISGTMGFDISVSFSRYTVCGARYFVKKLTKVDSRKIHSGLFQPSHSKDRVK
jgi:hypothetical protein